jgi:hypothetical protein
VCTGSQTSTDAAKSGTWTTSGTDIATDNGTPSPYCVSGTTLTVQMHDSSNKTTGAIVATKQ